MQKNAVGNFPESGYGGVQCRQMNVVVENEVRPLQPGKTRPDSYNPKAQKAWKEGRMLPDCHVGIMLKRGHNKLRDHADAAVIRA